MGLPVRVQVMGPDGQWWTVDAVGENDYVSLSRPSTETEKFVQRRHDDLAAGVSWHRFSAEVGDEGSAVVLAARELNQEDGRV